MTNLVVFPKNLLIHNKVKTSLSSTVINFIEWQNNLDSSHYKDNSRKKDHLDYIKHLMAEHIFEQNRLLSIFIE